MKLSPIKIGAIFGALAVIAGAFGAHALKEVLEPQALESYRTAVRYQMWHALALLLLESLPLSEKTKQNAAVLWSVGILFFSGSIYLLHLGPLMTHGSWNFLGPITPIGGLLLIGGWFWLFIAGLKKRT